MARGTAIADAYVRISVDKAGYDRHMANWRGALGRDTQSTGAFLIKLGLLTLAFRKLSGVVRTVGSDMVEFDRAMRQATSVTDVTAGELESMSRESERMAVSLGTSSRDAAKAFYYLGSAGLKVQEQLAAFPAVTTMAKGGLMDMGGAAQLTSDVIRAFRMDFEQTTYVVDLLSSAVTNSQMDFNQLQEAMSYAAGPAREFNNSLQDTVAAIAFFARVGIRGSRAGMALSTGLTRLAAPAGEGASALKKLNVEAYNQDGTFKSMVEILKEIVPALAKVSDEEKKMAMRQMFGLRSLRGLLELIDRGGGELEDFADIIGNDVGRGFKMAQHQVDSFSGAMDVMKEKIVITGRSFGNWSTGKLQKFLQAVLQADSLLKGQDDEWWISSQNAKIALMEQEKQANKDRIEAQAKIIQMKREEYAQAKMVYDSVVSSKKYWEGMLKITQDRHRAKIAELATDRNRVELARVEKEYKQEMMEYEQEIAKEKERQRISQLGIVTGPMQMWYDMQRKLSQKMPEDDSRRPTKGTPGLVDETGKPVITDPVAKMDAAIAASTKVLEELPKYYSQIPDLTKKIDTLADGLQDMLDALPNAPGAN